MSNSNTEYYANAPDAVVEAWDEAYEPMMKRGSAKLLAAIQRARGESFPCGHLKVANTHKVGDAVMCRACRAFRWERGFNAVVGRKIQLRLADQKVINGRNTQASLPGGSNQMWPRWYKPGEPFTSEDLVLLVARVFDKLPSEIKGRGRSQALVKPRRVIAKILRQRGWSYPRIGDVLGGRDHSTAINLLHNFEYHYSRSERMQEAMRTYCKVYNVPNTALMGAGNGQG